MKRYLIAGLALAALLTGCGDDAAPTTEVAATADSIDVMAVDYAFEGVPETAAVGTQLSLTNASEGEVHEIVLLKVNDDETRSLEELLEAGAQSQGPPDFATFQGVAVALPGEEGFVPPPGEGPLTLSEPGRYILACLIPTGADPAVYQEAIESGATEAPQAEGGPPHVAQGMAAEIIVE